jgi:hypothetical protein
LVLVAAAEAQQQAPQITPEVLAIAGTQQWLKVMDTDDYEKAWTYASEYLKNGVSKEDFKQRLQPIKGPLGRMKKRVLDASKYTTRLRDAPEGEWVVIKFKTVFENKAEAVETF